MFLLMIVHLVMEGLSVAFRSNKMGLILRIMQIGDIIQIIVALSKVRKLFWSEDDFKFAFATQVQLKFGKAA